MRKRQTHAIAFFFILITFASILSLYIPKSWAATENGDVQVIPNDAIRLRILANSNSIEDQEIKRTVRDRVNAQITEWVSELTSLKEARSIIVENLDDLKQIAYDVLAEYGVNQTVDITFDEVDFPTKLYGNFLYPAGSYEAVLITLGEGTGANWWCVLFPPLCFLDFSSGSAVSEGFDEDDQEATAVSAQPHDGQSDGKESSVQSTDGQSDGKEFVVHEEEEVEVKFFLVELFHKILDFIGSLFGSIF